MNEDGVQKKNVGKTEKASPFHTEHSSAQRACPVVGIGASAGGLEAFTRLLEHLPTTTGMAYVFIQHLDPTHPSLLASLLARVTTMPVHEVTDGMLIEPNQVYVIPPNATLILEQGTLTLGPLLSLSGERHAIDSFLHSLARERQSHAIGVLLSGTASDGTAGLQAIKAEGGVTFAQDAHSAAFSQMSQNAVATGVVDHILPPEEIARELARLNQQSSLQEAHLPAFHPSYAPPELPTNEEQSFTRVLHLLRNQTGVDFLSYKPATLKRRVLHCMATLRIANLAEYESYLQSHPAESEALSQDVLIPVTRFFRDEGSLRLWPSTHSPPWCGSSRLEPRSESGCLAAPRAKKSTPWPSACRSFWRNGDLPLPSSFLPPILMHLSWRTPGQASIRHLL